MIGDFLPTRVQRVLLTFLKARRSDAHKVILAPAPLRLLLVHNLNLTLSAFESAILSFLTLRAVAWLALIVVLCNKICFAFACVLCCAHCVSDRAACSCLAKLAESFFHLTELRFLVV